VAEEASKAAAAVAIVDKAAAVVETVVADLRVMVAGVLSDRLLNK
jgi:hypothetical protein